MAEKYYLVARFRNASSGYAIGVTNNSYPGTSYMEEQHSFLETTDAIRIPNVNSGLSISFPTEIYNADQGAIGEPISSPTLYLNHTDSGNADGAGDQIQYSNSPDGPWTTTDYVTHHVAELLVIHLEVALVDDAPTIVIGTVESMTDDKYKLGPVDPT